MGLTSSSTGRKAMDSGFRIHKQTPQDKVIALAGNPNVGKSTVFNGLTGMNQHTGNWPGKTVANAQGFCSSKEQSYVFIDIPGTYSLMAHSAEEEVARNFICFGNPDAVVVVCDATCLERNLNLVLQTIEISQKVIVCVNLMDEAKRKHLHIDLKLLEKRLGVPVVGTVARKRKTLEQLLKRLDEICGKEESKKEHTGSDVFCARKKNNPKIQITYPKELEEAIRILEPAVKEVLGQKGNSRWLSLKLLSGDPSLLREIEQYYHIKTDVDPEDFLCLKTSSISAECIHLKTALFEAQQYLLKHQIDQNRQDDLIVTTLVSTAEKISQDVVRQEKANYNQFDRRLDHLLTNRLTGYPAMLLLLALIFWITITGANAVSELLSGVLFFIQDQLTAFFLSVHTPDWLHGVLVLGMYRVLAWVISVMLPPMAIFFPLFTLLEDVGYLPRIAYNLDKPFERCHACGKQCLTMAMGFGCNAAGIVGCRIIDSPRERLLAILTNSFVPCNGRFPALLAILTMFFAGAASGFSSTLLSALLLTAVIVLGILMTFLVTKLLSFTLLKGIPSSFTLELPPYRKPQIGKILVRSICDRTLFVLGRAVCVAAPAGILLWLLANITIENVTLLTICSDFLDPFARLMGLDGVILIAFILGFPANEIVIPIIVMAYLAQGSIVELNQLSQMKELFIENGWTLQTAICTILFFLMHWPCSTTLLTIKKETGSWKWTFIAAALPTATGILCCILFTSVSHLFL